MAKNYKAMKEAFVSNHTGSSVSEINYVTLVAPVLHTFKHEKIPLLITLLIVHGVVVVSSSIATTPVHSLQPVGNFDRLPPKLCCNTIRYDHILFSANTP